MYAEKIRPLYYLACIDFKLFPLPIFFLQKEQTLMRCSNQKRKKTATECSIILESRVYINPNFFYYVAKRATPFCSISAGSTLFVTVPFICFNLLSPVSWQTVCTRPDMDPNCVFFCLILYVSVNNFSVITGRVFLR